jgi:hypothetical protein
MFSIGGKIMAPKGIKTVVMRKTGGKRENVTVFAACSATITKEVYTLKMYCEHYCSYKFNVPIT